MEQLVNESCVSLIPKLMALIHQMSFLPDTNNIKNSIMGYCVPYHHDWSEGKGSLLCSPPLSFSFLSSSLSLSLYLTLLFLPPSLPSLFSFPPSPPSLPLSFFFLPFSFSSSSLPSFDPLLPSLPSFLSSPLPHSFLSLGDTVMVVAPVLNIDTHGHFWLHEPLTPLVMGHLTLISQTLT